MRSIFIIQIAITTCLMAFYAAQNLSLAYAAAFGGLIACVNTLQHGWRLARMQRALAKNPKQDVLRIVLGATERFVFTLLMMIVGLHVLALEPTALLLAFAAAYCAYYIAAARIGFAKQIR